MSEASQVVFIVIRDEDYETDHILCVTRSERVARMAAHKAMMPGSDDWWQVDHRGRNAVVAWSCPGKNLRIVIEKHELRA